MEKKSAFGPSILPGIYLGVSLVLFSLITFLLDVDIQSPIKYVSWLILAAGLFWAIISFRDKQMGGFIDYKGAFSSGFYTGLIASIIAGLFMFVYVQYIDPGIIDQILLETEATLEQNPNMSDEQIEQALEMTESFTSPILMSVFGFLGNLVASTVLSLIIAIFAKRENKEIA